MSTLTRLLRSFAPVAVLPLLAALGPISARAAQTAYTNPLITTGNADPCIVSNNNGTFYLYTTGNNTTYRYHSSTNLVSWSAKNTTIWSPGDGSINVWAPDVKWDPAINKYVMMATNDFKFRAATGTSLTSAFTSVSTTQFPIKTGAIDPFLFRDWDGKYYLYYALWSNHAGWTEIMGRELPTSTSWNGVQNDHRLMIRYSGPDQGEHYGNKPLVEGPEVWRDRDTYYLIYSNSDWASPNYRALYATAKHPLGPWVKASNNPLIVRNDAKGIYGPGHGGNFTDAGGRLWHMYQQRPDATTSGSVKRQLAIDRLHLDPVTRLLSLNATRGTSVADGPITFPGNAMPVVAITAPAYGSVVAPGSLVNFTATATDANGTIAQVRFYLDGALVATDTSAPYAHSFTAVAGTRWLEAQATDNTGAIVHANAVKLVVGNQPPVVSAVRPLPIYVGADRPEFLLVEASDPDGSVARVDFYADGVLLGSDATAPYSITYAVPNQPYVRLKAVATDNQGLAGATEWPVYPWSKSAQTTYKGVKSVPGAWEAEDFDAIADPANPGSATPDPQYNAATTELNPGKSVSFFKHIDGWSGASNYRPNTRITLPTTADSTGGAVDLGEIEDGDWYEYTCNVAAPGAYDLVLRASSTSAANKILVTLDGRAVKAGGFLALPATSGYQDIVLSNLYFASAGQQRLRLGFATTAGKTLRINRLSVAASTAATYSVSGTATLGASALSGVTVTDDMRSVLTDASGNYTLAGLANGTHFLSASKDGNTFSPAAHVVAVSGAHVTGKNFSAALQAPVFAAGQSVFAPLGEPASYQLVASGEPASYALVSGSLPAGLTLNTATGVIGGTPTVLGTSSASFTATNSLGTSAPVAVEFSIVSGLIIHEPFAYAIGANNPDPDAGVNSGNGLPASNPDGTPAGTGTGLRSVWGATTDVVAGLVYSNNGYTLATSGGAARVNNATWGGQPYIYRGMTVDPFLSERVGGTATSNFGVPGTSLYVSLLGQTSSATADAFRLCFKYDGTANFYLANTATGWALNNNGAGNVVATGAALALNTPTFLVLRFDFASGSTNVSLWVNPPLGQALGTPQAAITGVTFPGLSNFQTRSAVANAMTVDELRIGTTLSSVTPHTP